MDIYRWWISVDVDIKHVSAWFVSIPTSKIVAADVSTFEFPNVTENLARNVTAKVAPICT